tara:strand:+ start:1781 stop:2299 length:519 start_codon:yes stop_codon:yes gene_type:complete
MNKIDLHIRNMEDSDAKDVLEIYQQGIDSDNASFLEKAPSWKHFNNSHIKEVRLIATDQKVVIGWAALSTIETTGQFGGVCEVSVYIAENYRNNGVGSTLLKNLIELSEKQNIWTLEANIFPENTASIELHKKFGFRVVGTREKVSIMKRGVYKGKWRDVTLMERRSLVAGI